MTGQNSFIEDCKDSIYLDQFLKVSNYEDTVKQLDTYYGIGLQRQNSENNLVICYF